MKLKVVIDGQTYDVDVEDIHARPVIAMVEGERYEVWPETEVEDEGETTRSSTPKVSVPEATRATTQMGESDIRSDTLNVTAPLPGVIVAVLVGPGDSVSRGDEVCTLEAMKMKNAIRANRDATIESVSVNVGDQVSHGQVLMSYTE